MNLWDQRTVRQVMTMFGLSFRKEFGQNFLTDPEVIDATADACSPTEDCTVLEIGPGIGTLTRSLAARYKRVIALEVDRSLIPVLRYTLEDCPNVTVVNEDVMQTDLPALLAEAFAAGSVAVCANLPYYITTPILMKLLESRLPFSGITVMVQAEVAAFGDGCAYVNREDDAGDRGLRTSKLQYGPAKLAPKYHFLPQNELLRHVSAIPELKTERLTLSAITEADIPAYNALVLDSDRNRWWGYDDVGGLGAPVTERSFYDVARRDFENRMAVNFAVRLNGTLIGEAGLYNFDYRGSAELGCRIDKAYAGNGYGTEAFRCAAEWGLYQVNLSRVVAKCYKENEASYKMLSACMRRNGEDETFFYFEKLV